MIRRIFVILLTVVMGTISVYAQSHLAKVVVTIDKSNNIISKIYSEERNETSRKLKEERCMITFSDPSFNKQICDAMKLDKPNSTEYKEIINSGDGADNAIYKITFRENKKYTTTYTLMLPGNALVIVTEYE